LFPSINYYFRIERISWLDCLTAPIWRPRWVAVLC